MKESDFIIDDETIETVPGREVELKGEYSKGDRVFLNTEEYTIEEQVDAKEIKDDLGFPVIYSWYKATDQEGKGVDLFFFDGDIDNVDSSGNEKLCRKWFEDYGEGIETE